MIKLFDKKQIILTFFAFLISTIAWGQIITGTGTAADPYVIDTDDDWDIVAKDEATYWGSNVYIKLGANITAEDAFIGYKDERGVIHSFKGHFDGDWHILTFDCGSIEEPYEDDYCAPFAYVDGAKISNTYFHGLIITRGKYAGEIIGCVNNASGRATEVTSCFCEGDNTIMSKATGAVYHGGLVGRVAYGEIIFKWCVFNGSITGENTTTHCAGFVGYVNGKGDDGKGSVSYQYCTMAYNNIAIGGNFATFNHLGNATEAVFDGHTYYTRRYEPDDQGEQAPNRKPDDHIAKIYTFAGNATTYYVPEAEIDLDPDVIYGGVLRPDVTYYGKKLTYGTHYNVGIKDGVVIVEGIEANGYAGKASISGITLIDITTWNSLKTFLNGSYNSSRRVVALDRDLTAANNETALVANGSGAITLNLNNHKLDRNLYDPDNDGVEKGYVLSVENGTTLTINGPGVITGGNNKGTQGNGNSRGDGGGIHVVSGGTLTLNNVTIKENKVIRSNHADNNCTFWGTGGGIYSKGTLVINDCTIRDNIADGGGGGINSQEALTMNRTLIANNKAQSKGGGLRTSKSPEINTCCIRDNILEFMNLNPTPDDEDGGGVYLDRYSGTAKFTSCIVNGNNAQWRGGGIYVNSGTAQLTNCEVKYNSGLGDETNPEFGTTGGGGIYLYSGTVDLNNTVITDNTSYTIGGVFVKTDKTLKIKGKTIINNNIGDATKANVYFESKTGKITVTGQLDASALIGISRDGKGVVTSGLTNNSWAVEDNFRSDNYQFYWLVKDDNKEVQLNSSLSWKAGDEQPDWGDNYYVDVDGKQFIGAPIIIEDGQIAIIDKPIKYGRKGYLFVEDGGQLVYNSGPSVKVSVIKSIDAASKDNKTDVYGWYTIASPTGEVKLSGNEAGVNLVTAVSAPYNFDLLRYNEEESLWESYNDPELNDFTTLKAGKGYLYRNSKGLTLEYAGNIKIGNVPVELTYSPGTAYSGLAGWNLIGNPYTHDITKGEDGAIDSELLAAGFYRLKKSGRTWGAELSDGTAIKPGEGILVRAQKAGTLTIKNIVASKQKANHEFIRFDVKNTEYDDVAYALFTNEEGLPKINHRDARVPMLYINKDGENYAIATMGDETKTFNLNFKAKTTGQYTLSCKTEGEFNYLHLIDCFTGSDIDMLNEEEYSFIASPKDKDSRFIVRLQYKPDYGIDEGVFAYQNDNDVLVSGEGELQVYDAMGRFVMSKRINGVETINLNATGVYILKLIGEDIRTQKMIVR